MVIVIRMYCVLLNADGTEVGLSSPNGYDPHLLDDPELTSGRHRKVLNLTSYLVGDSKYHIPLLV